MKKVSLLATAVTLLTFVYGCGGGSQPQQSAQATQEPAATEQPASNDEKGIGPIKEVTLNSPLDKAMVSSGKDVYELKCSSCHKLDNTKLVGPGWKGVTERRKPEWIMNFVTNVDQMLNEDPQAMAMLEECLVRMPNQNLSEKDARNVLEFMLDNDAAK